MSGKEEEATMLEELIGEKVSAEFFYGEKREHWTGIVDKVEENLVHLTDAKTRDKPCGPQKAITLVVNTKSLAFVRLYII